MIGKLLENWLDSASERSYQQVFVQLLANNGYKVLHSTRHCLLEFGKDILAVAPDGVGCAFQLKGDPLGQMTIGEFRNGIQQQLVQLMAQSPCFPGFPQGEHRSYLVSNGSFSEEVQIAIAQMNAGPYPSKVELWSRGTLLDMTTKVSESLWPSEIPDTRRLLEIYMADPEDQLSLSSLAEMLASILHLTEEGKALKEAEFRRAASSALWATGIALSTYARVDNHQAVAYGWTLCRCLLQCAELKFGHANKSALLDGYQIAERAIADALAALWEEVQAAQHLVLPPALEDSVIYGWRVATLQGMFSALLLLDSVEHCLTESARSSLLDWIVSGPRPLLWGEGAVGQIYSLAIALGGVGRQDDMCSAIRETASAVIAANQSDSLSHYPSPYYGADDALRIQLNLKEEAPDSETFAGAAFTARPLMHCLALLGDKEACKELWPGYSLLSHRHFEFAHAEDYLAFKAHEGSEVTKIYSETYEWPQLVAEADSPDNAVVVQPLWLQCMWWQVAPHRADAASMTEALKSLAGYRSGR